ncbi:MULTISPECIES: uroporphyrinogen-III synthase [Bradyrhizobium]|uniref:uroporphyrinogen-III synthase n=1 Tax=Bradyrhizobium TaxID=374 RepID=UPI00155E1D55|nr:MULTISPECIES: uroporphyrinogen-III synthase [Bradyrhizobium]MDD1518381.1 uroporphyrinogen III synthase [Bradyrhizobium sp. WBAH30]MDD1542178.1 uroporphyrinogen III synthase [Bradyrhizobium sp. WBAH41]MDD1556330.1 uroporphyrinogen III synthase [Bradyrhizobium sp. WBAH23]MDD1561829.1 uroporphyrinogen III synthase [Bradyrhizobium sp. WBAH33]MDD1589150.1 uroporphyrinogen III synthase [Bradyrhizobium sp. WBAH42]
MADRLNGYRILILETREEAQFSKLLAEQGAEVVQCPMFTIRDAPDPAPVEAWIRRAIDKPFDDLVLMTGEGLRRIMKLARARGLDAALIAVLAQARKFSRGPKPGKALREIGLEAQQTTEKPTSEGVIEMLAKLDLKGRRLGLQLYPDKDHSALTGALAAQGATVDTVLPYVYDSKAADASIVAAIDDMAEGRIDSMALTNLGQVRRLIEAAKAHGSETKLRAGLERTLIASVGPAVSGELAAHGLRTDVSPADEAYFMRPLISAMASALADRKAASAAR